MKENRVI